MIAKCGQHRVWHWAHRETRTCDTWSEPETEWHRDWKSHFPKHCQEVIHWSENGEKHIADVKTESGVVLEFHYSLLSREERQSREIFYGKMVWVDNGQRRKRDMAQFFASLRAAIVVSPKPLIVAVPPYKGALLRDWGASRVPVYFDFGDSEPDDKLRFNTPTLWRLDPVGRNSMAYLSPVPKTLFLRVHLQGLPFEERHTKAIERAADAMIQQAARSRPLADFERYMAEKQRARRRF
jgi:competence protein CoiA